MRIAIVGPGRLGRSLAVMLPPLGVAVELIGRDQAIPGTVDAVLLTVPDAAIGSIQGLPSTPVLHTSGATPFEVLRPHRPAGSFHPLMTFPGPHALPDLAGVTATIAGDPAAIAVGHRLAEALQMAPLELTGDRRLYHAAAVMAGNFATVLLADAAAALRAAGVPADRAAGVLAPLALRSIENAVPEPAAALTGPVARGDQEVIAGHLAALADAGLLEEKAIYEALTQRAKRLIEEIDPTRETQGDTGSPK